MVKDYYIQYVMILVFFFSLTEDVWNRYFFLSHFYVLPADEVRGSLLNNRTLRFTMRDVTE